MVNENDKFKRASAVKSSINNIINGEFIKISDEFKPSYVVSLSGKHIARANIIGIIISDVRKNETNADFTIDDSTGSVTIRTFEENIINKLNTLKTGSLVMIIGKPRMFNNSIYIAPEIIKELDDKRWIDLRKKELAILEKGIEIKEPQIKATQNTAPEKNIPESRPTSTNIIEKGKSKSDYKKPEIKKEVPKVVIEEEDYDSEEIEEISNPITDKKIKQDDSSVTENPFDKIIRIIKELDEGRGADFEKVIEKSGIVKAEEIINNLLLEGEIFEISPGKLKVL